MIVGFISKFKNLGKSLVCLPSFFCELGEKNGMV